MVDLLKQFGPSPHQCILPTGPSPITPVPLTHNQPMLPPSRISHHVYTAPQI